MAKEPIKKVRNRDSFKKPIKSEKEKRDKLREEAAQASKAAIAAARALLNTDEFREYRKKIEETERKTIDAMLTIRFTNIGDPMKYSLYMDSLICDYQAARALLDLVLIKAKDKKS